jgi:formylglycine-generating enzyme required for sulfatase activity
MPTRARSRTRAIWLPFVAALLVFGSPAFAVTIDWVPVGNPGNANDTTGFGGVSSAYSISKYEITNGQYAEFLNAKAASDPLALWNSSMAITRSGVSGSFAYAANSGFANNPVGFVSFYDSLRFANWLNNGQGTGSTETGAYTLLGGTPTPSNGATVIRNALATTVLTSENEWYKAAYFNGTSYFTYPTNTNTAPTCSTPTATPNRANCTPGGPNALTDVGAYPGSAGPYGTFDQGGNAAEWTESLSSGNRVIRGGNFTGGPGQMSTAGRVDFVGPTFEGGSTGIRLALVPEPGTGLLVMLGLAGLAARRRRLD